MSKWCFQCKREPYIGCDSNCPVFGCDFEALAEKCLELFDACSSGTKTQSENKKGDDV